MPPSATPGSLGRCAGQPLQRLDGLLAPPKESIGAVLAEVERHQPVRQAGMRGVLPAKLTLALGEDASERLLALLESLDVPDGLVDGPAPSEEDLEQEFAPEAFLF